MPRGRKRKFNPLIPSHIDQANIPRGVYFDPAGYWYALEPDPEGPRPRRQKIGNANARLSELHAYVEARAGLPKRGSLQQISDAFGKSTEFAELSAATRKDYAMCAAVVTAYPTKLGVSFGMLEVDKLSTPIIQRLVEDIARDKPESRPGAGDAKAGTPSKANHVLRYLRRLFAWGIRFGLCASNPARGVREAKERKRRILPDSDAFVRLLRFAWERGQLVPGTKGAVPPYLALMMELAYACRLRGAEVLRLTDASAREEGIYCARTKGSLDNITAWTPRLRAVWTAAIEIRREAFERTRRPVPMRPEERALIVGRDATPLVKSTFDTAWQRLIAAAIEADVIKVEERFSLHPVKRRGITDTRGTKAEKRDASGHATEAAFQIYDFDVPVVPSAGTAEFSGEFSGPRRLGPSDQG